MTKKFSWEVDKTSLILRVTDGDRKTEWIVRKNTSTEKLRGFLGEMMLELTENPLVPAWEGKPMIENVRTVDAEELQKTWEESSRVSVQADTEEGSLEALRARERVLRQTAKWWDNDDEESAFVASLPDYDTGEI